MRSKESRARELADIRFGQALWYAYGRQAEANAHNGILANSFAQFARDEAYKYHLEDTYYLDSIQDQYARWEKLPNRHQAHHQDL